MLSCADLCDSVQGSFTGKYGIRWDGGLKSKIDSLDLLRRLGGCWRVKIGKQRGRSVAACQLRGQYVDPARRFDAYPYQVRASLRSERCEFFHIDFLNRLSCKTTLACAAVLADLLLSSTVVKTSSPDLTHVGNRALQNGHLDSTERGGETKILI